MTPAAPHAPHDFKPPSKPHGLPGAGTPRLGPLTAWLALLTLAACGGGSNETPAGAVAAAPVAGTPAP